MGRGRGGNAKPIPSPWGRARASRASMSTPNPLAPQGSLLEKQGRGRSSFQIIGFIGALHVFVLCALLWIGCKQDKPAGALDGPDSALPGQDGGLPPVAEPPSALNPIATNPLPATGANPPPVAPPVAGVGADGLPPTPAPGTAPAETLPLPVPSIPGAGVGPDTGADATGGAAPSEHKVVSGETGAVIAKKYGVSVKALQAANPSVNWNRMKIGQVLAIPSPTAKAADATPGVLPGSADGAAAGGSGGGSAAEESSSYTVRPGDTGSRIAKKFGVSWRKIRDLNGLTSDGLKPGQKLNIPAKGAATAPAPTGAAAPAAAPVPVAPVVTPLPSTGGR